MQNQTWTFTSKSDGSSSQGLSNDEAVKLLYRAMHGLGAPAELDSRRAHAQSRDLGQGLDLRSAA